MNELTDENECLREQLGMDPKKPVDIKDFQSKISVKREEQRALNIVLQKEVREKYITNSYPVWNSHFINKLFFAQVLFILLHFSYLGYI